MTKTPVLQKQTLKTLDLVHVNAWRQNNAGVYDVKKKVFRANSVGMPGQSDTIGYSRRNGRIVAVEIKGPGDSLSEDQEAFLIRIQRAGGYAFVIYTIDCIMAMQKELMNHQ